MVLLIFTSLLFFWLGAYLWCALLATSPVGALVCWNSARRRGHAVGRPALAGVLYWACWFLPWVYYVYCSDGRDVPAWLVKAGYGVLFFTWLIGPVFGGFSMAWSLGGDPYFGDVWFQPWLLVASCLNVVAVALSVICLIGRKEGSPNAEYIDWGAVAPFGLAAVGSAMYLPLVIIVSIDG